MGVTSEPQLGQDLTAANRGLGWGLWEDTNTFLALLSSPVDGH